jgi:hypothetical protein
MGAGATDAGEESRIPQSARTAALWSSRLRSRGKTGTAGIRGIGTVGPL